MRRRRREIHQQGTRKSAFFVSADTKTNAPQRFVYIAFYKPYGVLSQFTSQLNKRTLGEFGFPRGVYPVGRLDEESEGLLLLTNDNGLKHQLTDPAFDHEKTYLVQVERIPPPSTLQLLREGILIGSARTKPARVRLMDESPRLPARPVPIRFRKDVETSWLEMTITEGKNRQIRRMTAAVGHPTLRLVRIRVADLSLGNLKPGEWKNVARSSILEK